MTFIKLEDAPTDQEEIQTHNDRTVKCSWCGEIIQFDGKELPLAMCEDCFDRMLADFVRQQQTNPPLTHASDR